MTADYDEIELCGVIEDINEDIEICEEVVGNNEITGVAYHSGDEIRVNEVNNKGSINRKIYRNVDGCAWEGDNLWGNKSRNVNSIEVDIQGSNCGGMSEDEGYTLDETYWSSGVGRLKPGVKNKNTEGDQKGYFKLIDNAKRN